MKLVYSRRALADLDEIAAYYSTRASPAVAKSIEGRLVEVIERICRMPEAAPRVSQRSHVRVATVVRYPYRIFYRLRDDTIDILHIRHTSRRPAGAMTPRG
jgi:toxin ParE1/3/4